MAEAASPGKEVRPAAPRTLAELAEGCAGEAWRLARRFCGGAEAAADAVQEAFLGVVRAARKTRIEDFRAYFLAAVVREARRRGRREAALSLDRLPEPAAPDGVPASLAEKRELAAALAEELLKLPGEWREVLVLRHWSGLSQRKVAAAQGLSQVAVLKRERRAQDELRGRLARRGFALGTAALVGLLGAASQAEAGAVPAGLAAKLAGLAAGGAAGAAGVAGAGVAGTGVGAAAGAAAVGKSTILFTVGGLAVTKTMVALTAAAMFVAAAVAGIAVLRGGAGEIGPAAVVALPGGLAKPDAAALVAGAPLQALGEVQPLAASGAPAAGSCAEHGAPDGFGRSARGGAGAVRNVDAAALAAALSAGGNIRCAGGELDADYDRLQVPGNTTLDGGGLTIWLPGDNRNGRGLEVAGASVILRNLRVRNAGDGISFGSAGNRGRTRDVLVENCSVTGSGDDGFAVAYDCANITLRWCLAAGNTRTIFVKYGGRNLTVHHSILTHFWIRGPLVSGPGAALDFRNNLVQNWSLWGSRSESGGQADFVNNTWRQYPWAGGEGRNALFAYQGGQVYSSGNAFEGCQEQRSGFSSAPLVNGPPVPTEPAAAALTAVLSDTCGAGCMPRDQVDRNYLDSRARCPGGDPAVGLQVEGSGRVRR